MARHAARVTMRRLVLVDGGNILLRCAFGGQVPPERSTPIAVGMIERCIKDAEATHLIVATDCPRSESWRRAEFPAYKADRTTDTAPWIAAGVAAFGSKGWAVKGAPTFEADDVLATLAMRAAKSFVVVVLTNDSDLFTLCDVPRVLVVRPGKEHEIVGTADVLAKYKVKPAQLPDWKAMVGEVGDNVPGVPTIGPQRAAAMLALFPDLDSIITAGHAFASRDTIKVAKHEAQARLALRLVQLRVDVPFDPINPAECKL